MRCSTFSGAFNIMPKCPANAGWAFTLIRAVAFCLCCAVVLAISSRLVQGHSRPWSEIVAATIASLGAFLLTRIFVKFEGLNLRKVGVLAGRQTTIRVLTGFISGLLLAGIQCALVLMSGHLVLLLICNGTCHRRRELDTCTIGCWGRLFAFWHSFTQDKGSSPSDRAACCLEFRTMAIRF